jgi:N4-gp56 family major capsid protein
MTIQTTTLLPYATRAQYIADYIAAAQLERLYDNISSPIGKEMGVYTKGSSVVVNYAADLQPTTETISEISDVTPATIRDAIASVAWTSRRNAIQASEKLLNSAYTPYGKERFEIIGRNMMESVDLVALEQAVTGGRRGAYGNTARASLDAATNYYLNAGVFTNAESDLLTLKCPAWLDAGRRVWAAIMHPYAFADLRASTTILAVGEYQKANIILGHELGELGPFKIVSSPFAHVFWGAGSANASAIATTIAAEDGTTEANKALDTHIEVAANTNIDAGDWLLVGTIETGDTLYPTNERVQVLSVDGTTIEIVGSGPNGGLRFDHAVGETVSNADSVFPTVFGGPRSLAKVFDVNTGEYGETVGPDFQGLLKQWISLGWKWYGNYDVINQSNMYRYESTCSRDA